LDDRLDDPVDVFQLIEIVFDIARRDQLRRSPRHQRGGIGLLQLLNGALGDGAPIVTVLRHYIQQQDRHAGIGDLGGDAAAHHARADDASLLDGHSTASRMVAMPWPPPMHWVDSANCLPSRFSNEAALPVMRAPVAPKGWPMAMAPPSRLTLAMSIFKSRMQAMDCAAKASLSSM